MDQHASAEPGPTRDEWPALPLAEWSDTRDTLILWTQIVGKLRLSHSPLLNHWWNVPLYVTARGLTTSLMWTDDSRGLQIDFDLLAHRLEVQTTDGGVRSMALEPRTVADFHAELMHHLDELRVDHAIWTMPVEIEGAIPFDQDQVHRSYDRDQVERFWQLLVRTSRVLNEYRTTFVGKSSPVHLFWGALDLAETRFSGRPAPLHPGGAPNCGPHVMHEAYSDEVSSCGYWPGGDGEGLFYAYAYPEPAGYQQAPVEPPEAHYDAALGEFVLPYEVVRTAPDPAATLLAFLESTHEAAADTGGWDRSRLEREVPPWAPDRIASSGAGHGGLRGR